MTWPLPFGAAAGGAILVLVALGVWLFLRRRRRVAAALGDPALLARLLGDDLRRVPWRRVALVLLGATALAAALLDPRWGAGEGGGESAGGPVVLVIDVSNSMLVEDVDPSRLAWARATATRLLRELGDVPVGIVVFAGRAYALTPPTRDAGAVDLYLDALDTRMITQTGSAVAGALRQGVGLLLAGEGEGGAMVVISDGNTVEEPAELESAIDLARRAGIAVHTIGVGTTAGGPVPDLDPVTGERVGYKSEATGEVVESHLAEEVLAAVASGTGGSYWRAQEVTPGELARAVWSRQGGEGGRRMQGPPRFAWFAAAALLLLAIEGVVGRADKVTR